MNTYFFTGFPGFLATSLVKKIIAEKDDISHFYLLVLPEFQNRAKIEVNRIVAEAKLSADHFTIIPGDITKPNLKLPFSMVQKLQEEVTHIFHLAAIYDLAVPKELAYDVNVLGTKNINDWILTLKNVKRYVYFSTAYVSGKREGLILETDLDMQQQFKNHYESTKFEAEKLVHQVIDQVATTIIRPGIVKGHSKTGETLKFDGPYFVLNFFDRLKWLPRIPYLGEGEVEGNFVPVDYVINATVYLGHKDIGIGKTYHLTDPNPYSMRQVYQMLMSEYLGKNPFGTIPLSLARVFLSIPYLRKWTRVEKESLDYFQCQTKYDCTHAQADLKDSGIVCPDLRETVGAMVEFYKKHKSDEDKQIKIV
ncbi:SDR family oxidoreductase [Anaerobacillus sp. CMMVII]|uniref:SDR family oxidoreductase n=1 Tax=Anaerobacillus sp. CMMVII TaxID=2755588 RepID=UPI0021B7347C|nr:SDR family oxidoreductase [Anaerobacillus sp. CMMVII]MCT8137196.1 SDR family oxidoreductase [Anaerobacillus sp. CMMVII]